MVTRYYLIQCQRGHNITNNPNRKLQTNNYITVINHPQQKDGIVTEQEEKNRITLLQAFVVVSIIIC